MWKLSGCMCIFVCQSDLADGVGERLNNLLMRCGHHALPVDLYNPVSHADPPSLGDASSHQAADLHGGT